jgi:hypothetical protein
LAPVAQGIEQQIPNLLAAGSIPAGGTTKVFHPKRRHDVVDMLLLTCCC